LQRSSPPVRAHTVSGPSKSIQPSRPKTRTTSSLRPRRR
jgi:hypothetical protein